MARTRMILELTEDQTGRYLEWARRTQAEDDPLPAVTIAFTLTNIGAHVVASRGEAVFRGGSTLVLQDILDPLPDPVRFEESGPGASGGCEAGAPGEFYRGVGQ